MSAFRKQIELANEKESKYVVNQIPKIQQELGRVTKALGDKIAGGDFSDKDLAAWEKSVEMATKMIETCSELLGYTGDQQGDESEFSLRLKGKSAPWSHTLPAPQNGNREKPKNLEIAEEID